LDVVLKFATGTKGKQSLLKEAHYYNGELLPAQGVVVPEYVGIFGATVPTDTIRPGGGQGNETVTCLVVTYVGAVPPVPVGQLLAEERLRLFLALLTLHSCGIYHGDLHARNIRLDSTKEKVYFIDFESAEKHACKHRPITIAGELPDPTDFGCPEIYGCAELAKIWMDFGRMNFEAELVPLRNIDRWEDLLDYVWAERPVEEREKIAKAGFGEALSMKNNKVAKYIKENQYFWTDPLGKGFISFQ